MRNFSFDEINIDETEKELGGKKPNKIKKKISKRKKENTLKGGFPLITVDLLPLFGMLALKILSDDIHVMVMMVIMFNGDDGDAEVVLMRTSCLNCFDCDVWTPQAGGRRCCWSCETRLKTIPRTAMVVVIG